MGYSKAYALNRRRTGAQYVVAGAAPVVALLLSLLFHPIVEPNPFIFFFAAVAFSAWFGGLRPGLLTTILSLAITNYALIPPYQAFPIDLANLLRSLVFLFVGGLISSLTEARRQAEVRFAVTLSSIGDAVIATDLQSRVTFLNPVAQALTGWTAQEAIGKHITTIFRIINAHTRQPVENPVARVLRDGIVVGLANHTLLIARDGTEYPIDDSGAPIISENGKLSGAVLIFRDITERERAEAERAALLASEQALRAQLDSVLERITDAVVALDHDWRYTYVNTQATKLLRKTREELLGHRIWDLFPDIVGDISYQEMHRALEEQAPRTFSRFYAPFNVWTATRIYPSPDGLTLYVHDITAEQAARQAEAQALQQVKEAVKRIDRLQRVTVALSAALTPSEVAAVVVEQAMQALEARSGAIGVVVADGSALEIVFSAGYPPGALDVWMRLPMDMSLPFPDVVRTGEPLFVEAPDMFFARYPQLSNVPMMNQAWALIPLRWEDRTAGGMFLGFAQARSFPASDKEFLLTLGRQCTQALERARLYEAEREARRQAEAAVRLRDQFLSVAAHELKTPLTAVMGNAQLFQRRAEREQHLSERDQHALQVINEQVTRLNKMVLTLLDVSRLEMGQLAIDRQPIDLRNLVRRVVAEIAPTAEDRAIQFVCPAEPIIIQGDELRLEQVLQNLIQNALKYSWPPQPVSITVTEEGHGVRVVVRDEGMGIPADALPNLFQRFYRAPNAEAQFISGMGIGLYVVKEIVTLHGGTVVVESAEGSGSTFTIWLPLVKSSADA